MRDHHRSRRGLELPSLRTWVPIVGVLVGLGLPGQGIAASLLGHGFKVVVLDKSGLASRRNHLGTRFSQVGFVVLSDLK